MRTFVLLTIALSVLLDPSVQAAPPARPAFGEVDANGDGSVSFDEFRAQLERSAKERASSGSRRGELFSKLSPEQRHELLQRMFARTDRNSDGRIDADEWESAAAPAPRAAQGRAP